MTQTINKLTIKNGKFFRNGEEEKPEIGNAEQIQALRKHEKAIEKLQNEGIKVTPEFTAIGEIRTKCICGNTIRHEEAEEDTEDIDFNGKQIHCYGCGLHYEIEDDGGDILLKIVW